MLGKTPDFSQPPSKSSDVKAVADLAAVSFYPSHVLCLAQLCIYLAMLVFSLLALIPFFIATWYWFIVWLIFASVLAVAGKRAQREKNSPPKHLQVIQQQWRLSTSAGAFSVRPDGELLLWSWLIIIPVRELLSGKLHYLVALPDSLDKESWRRLSAWLNLCFTKL